jgi:signal peptidase I
MKVAALVDALRSGERCCPVRRYSVEGRSMLQAFGPGDRVVVEALTYRLRPPRIGEVVLIRRAAANGGLRYDLKRIAAGPGALVMSGAAERRLGPDEWFVLGDNLGESQDSRQLGPVGRMDITARVWFRYYQRDKTRP